MNKLVIAASMIVSTACVDVDELEVDVEVETEAQAALAYWPMGVAQVTASGAIASSFTSNSATASARRLSTGRYEVGFPGLGVIGGAASQGNVQVVARGTNNRRCQLRGTALAGSTRLVYVDCHAASGSPADAEFSVLHYRTHMPAPSAVATRYAYTLVDGDGTIPSPAWDYNSSGVHNTAWRSSPGSYRVTIDGSSRATVGNASVMVTAADPDQPGNVCGVRRWGYGVVEVACQSPTGVAEDTDFSLSYAATGPTIDQQGAHTWFDGSIPNPIYTAVLGKLSCSPATLTASRSGSLARVTVSGDLGSWDGSPFVHVPFATHHGGAGYCKIESSTASGTAPAWTGTATVRCYDPTGAVVATPKFAFTDVTSEASGPC